MGQSPETPEKDSEIEGYYITKEDVKENQDGFRTSAKTKKEAADTHNEYAKKITDACGNNQELKAIAYQYINDLPKSS